jgi:hypothetical protein
LIIGLVWGNNYRKSCFCGVYAWSSWFCGFHRFHPIPRIEGQASSTIFGDMINNNS